MPRLPTATLLAVQAAAAGLMTLVLTVSSAAAQAPAFAFHEPHRGVIAAVVNPEVPSYPFANSFIVIGTDSVLVLDTQQSPRATLYVLREIRRRTPLPVRWVVNSHWHADHTWGTQVYADSFPDVRFLATPATRDTLAAAWRRQVADQREHTLGSRARLEGMLAEETDPAGWVRALDRVLAMDPAWVLPSHGGLRDDLALVRSQKAELEELIEP